MRGIRVLLLLLVPFLMQAQPQESIDLSKFPNSFLTEHLSSECETNDIEGLSDELTNTSSAILAADELRGTWLAWAGAAGNVPSRARIESIMADLANAGLNTVCVPTWRYGYTYFRSEVFHGHTGLYTDPGLAAGRDVLAEMVEAAHNNGLKVVAWFEWGFAGAISDSSPMWIAHPDWFAKQRNGNQIFEHGSRWFIHTHPEVHEFLIEISREVLEKYDVDGIQMDRIRYPDLDCGYDDYTKSLYFDENGTYPPSTTSSWRAWRANKLNSFVSRYYNEMKAVEPNIPVSNAPIAYPYGYNNFCQNWPVWINLGYLDFVIPQVYRADNSAYRAELDRQLSYVTVNSRVYPGITAIYNGALKTPSQVVAEVNTTRSRNLEGHVLWFHEQILNDLPTLRSQVYQQDVPVPARANHTGYTHSCFSANSIVIDAADATRNGSWASSSSQAGYLGAGYYHDGNEAKGAKSIVYTPNITQSGSYEVFAIHTAFSNRPTNVPFDIQHFNGTSTASVNQRANHGKWVSLGTYDFAAGGNNSVTLRTTSTSGYVIADAVRFTFRECRDLATDPVAPVAVNDSGNVTEGESVIINILNNDSDANGDLDASSVGIVSSASNGSTSINTTTGAITYTPNANFAGADSFTYTVSDDSGLTSNIATVNVTVNAFVPEYCNTQGNNTYYEWIAQVQVGGFTKNSGSDNGYADYTSDIIYVLAGETHNIRLTPGYRGTRYNENWKIWLDKNQDGDFFDAGEELYAVGTVTSNPVTGTITIPTDALPGRTRMRVGMNGTSADYTLEPCSPFTYGEVEDYTVEISIPAPVAPVAVNDEASVAEGESVAINVLDNDTDANGNLDATSVVIVSTTTNGALALNNSTGVITYTPDAGFIGSDSFTYTVSDTDGLVSNTATVSITVTEEVANCTYDIASVTVDNGSAGYSTTGSWAFSTSNPGYIGSGYYHDNNSGKGNKTATYSPSIAGVYEVFTWYTAFSNRPTNVTYRVNHAGGTTDVLVNQQINNTRWVSLGQYTFDLATTDKVVITTAGTEGYYVIADAVKFDFVACTTNCTAPSTTEVIVDDANATYTGSWGGGANQGYYGSGYRYATNSGSKTATFTPNLEEEGSYELFIHYVAGSNRATNARVDIHELDGTISSVNVNQRVNGSQWNSLGTYDMGTDTKAVLTNQGANNIIIADAFRWVYVGCASSAREAADALVEVEESSVDVKASTLSVYPNPFLSTLNLNVTTDVAGKAQVEVLDMVGKAVYNMEAQVVSGESQIELNGNTWDVGGIYVIRVHLPNGETKFAKVVKQ